MKKNFWGRLWHVSVASPSVAQSWIESALPLTLLELQFCSVPAQHNPILDLSSKRQHLYYGKRCLMFFMFAVTNLCFLASIIHPFYPYPILVIFLSSLAARSYRIARINHLLLPWLLLVDRQT